MADALLRVENLRKHFPITRGVFGRVVGAVRAVDDVTFEVRRGECLGLVGESGSGKTTVARTVLRALTPTGGRIWLHVGPPPAGPVDLAPLSQSEVKPFRRHMQMVFQDPYSSLNPRMTVFDIIGEPLLVNGMRRRRDRETRVRDLLAQVGLQPHHLRRYPHAFSGGQRQRIGIARALALEPELVVADEPVSALDVSVQAQTLNLLVNLQERLGLTYLLIAHDLSVVRHICQRVAVMYAGRLVEVAPTPDLFAAPLHPYTEALLSAAPVADPTRRPDRIVLGGEVADPADPPPGCLFHPRCRYAQPVCAGDPPDLRALAPGRLARCHFADRLTLKGLSL